MKRKLIVNSKTAYMRTARLLIFAAAVVFCALPIMVQTQEAAEPATSAQKTFDTPDQAVDALIAACDNYDASTLLQVLGPDSKDLFSSTDQVNDKNNANEFAVKAREKHTVTVSPKDKNRAALVVGNDDWPFPIPLVKEKGKWRFDSKQGHDEILFRRIGANELDAIQVCRGYVEAQKEYASEIRDDSGVNQYAQKIISTPGKHDGLFWKNDDGSPGGPISEAVARAVEEGYSGQSRAYHGYYFKILKGQGPAAPMGELDYVVGGIMIGGFALVAVPAEYRVTGVKTFIVSYDGTVYQKDLGPDSLEIAKKMDRYNPDKSWHPTDDEWPPDVSEAAD